MGMINITDTQTYKRKKIMVSATATGGWHLASEVQVQQVFRSQVLLVAFLDLEGTGNDPETSLFLEGGQNHRKPEMLMPQLFLWF